MSTRNVSTGTTYQSQSLYLGWTSPCVSVYTRMGYRARGAHLYPFAVETYPVRNRFLGLLNLQSVREGRDNFLCLYRQG
jgi:hypothetical protein